MLSVGFEMRGWDPRWSLRIHGIPVYFYRTGRNSKAPSPIGERNTSKVVSEVANSASTKSNWNAGSKAATSAARLRELGKQCDELVGIVVDGSTVSYTVEQF